MKIVHLNTYDGNGGAGRASYRLNQALVSRGIQSELKTLIKFGDKENIEPLFSCVQKPFIVGNILMERYLVKFYQNEIKVPYSLQKFGKNIHHHKAIQDADIIHLHWINHGFLTPRNLAKLAKLHKPIVWTMHDCNVFTGGCHVRFGCERYVNQCGYCPYLKNSGANDYSNQLWQKKNEAYRHLKMHVISPSKWLGEAAQRSGLLKNFPLTVIPNTLETAIFRPYNKQDAKQYFGVNPDKFVVLSGFMPSVNDAHKGGKFLYDALRNWVNTNPGLKDKITLVVFGNKDSQKETGFDFEVKYLGTISNDDLLAKAYSAADTYISTSLDDNLPNTIMESLSCGTPVVSFATGGIPDMIDHLESGYLAAYKDTADLIKGLAWMYHHENRQQLALTARKKVINNFSEAVIAEKHNAFYQQLR